ncbi:MAG: transposase [Gemmatimonadales bacterium]|nr:transposase [Gemmatimonadales bacterium]
MLATIADGSVSLSPMGRCIQEGLHQLPNWWPGVAILETAIMPDHLHLLLELRDEASVTVPRLMCRFKGVVTRLVRERGLLRGARLWQRGYHDRVIRTHVHLHRVRRYIRDNPLAWENRSQSR